MRVPFNEIGQRAGRMICQRPAGEPVAEKIVNTWFERVVRSSG